MKDNDKAINELARLCGQPTIKLQTDLKRDFYLTAAEAAAYGLIDKVLLPNQVNLNSSSSSITTISSITSSSYELTYIQ